MAYPNKRDRLRQIPFQVRHGFYRVALSESYWLVVVFCADVINTILRRPLYHEAPE